MRWGEWPLSAHARQQQENAGSPMQAPNALRSVIAALMAANAGTLAAASAGASPKVPDEASIAQVRQGLSAGRYNVRALEQHYAQRIASIDRSGPRINSVIELNPQAGQIAAGLDAASDHSRPLFGVPILIKDNIDTADGMLTTAGSLALGGSKPSRDAFIVRRLREAGALILGKTN